MLTPGSRYSQACGSACFQSLHDLVYQTMEGCADAACLGQPRKRCNLGILFLLLSVLAACTQQECSITPLAVLKAYALLKFKLYLQK